MPETVSGPVSVEPHRVSAAASLAVSGPVKRAPLAQSAPPGLDRDRAAQRRPVTQSDWPAATLSGPVRVDAMHGAVNPTTSCVVTEPVT